MPDVLSVSMLASALDFSVSHTHAFIEDMKIPYLNIPTVFVSGGPMEAGEWNGQHLDLIDAMIKSADESVGDKEVAQIEHCLLYTSRCV